MQKYQYKHSGIEWLGRVPVHWKHDKLFRMCHKMGSGGTPKSTNEEYYGGDIPWIQSGDLTDSYVSETEKKITGDALANSSAKIFPKGTLLVALYGATIGKLGIMGMDAATNQACCALQLSKKTESKYMYFLMLDIREYLITQAYGGGQQNISQEVIKQISLFYPPLPEQTAIAEYLDLACARIDRIIAIKEEQLEKIKEIRKSRIDELICFGSDFITETKSSGFAYLPKIKKDWLLDRFKDVAKMRDEKTDEKSEIVDYLELEDIDQGTGQILGKRNTLEVESKVTKFYAGDVLFGKLRPYLEKYHYAEFDGKCTGEILAFQPERINGKFLMYILGSKWFIDLCISMSYGAKMPRVNWNTQLALVNLPLPSITEQEEIVEQLDNLSQRVRGLKRKVTDQIETLRSYRKSLIHECVTGKKQVADRYLRNKDQKQHSMEQFLLYKNESGNVRVEVLLQEETIWLTQKALADLFQVGVPAIAKHIGNIYESGELTEVATISKMETVQLEGKRSVKRTVIYYNLDVIIAVGYRVNSIQATQFRIWATNTIKEFIIKGFVLDDERLKQGRQLFGKDYFDELLERIREIRASERRFYQKITDIYALSADYDKNAIETKDFFANVQNKLHWAITGKTAAEIIYTEAEATRIYMGLKTWKHAPEGKVLKSDVSVAKNYLNEKHISELNRIVSAYLDLAENNAQRSILMRMKQWREFLENFLKLSNYPILKDRGTVTALEAKLKAESEFDKYRIIQDQMYESDFDKEIKKLKK